MAKFMRPRNRSGSIGGGRTRPHTRPSASTTATYPSSTVHVASSTRRDVEASKARPPKVRALAALKYAQESEYRKLNAAKAKVQVKQSGNALGII